MNELLDDAVKALRNLPEDMQAKAARVILDYTAGYEESATA